MRWPCAAGAWCSSAIDAGARALIGSATRVLDLGGRTVIPGMMDAHAHVAGLGAALRTVDLVGTTSYDEVIARVVGARRRPAQGRVGHRTRLGPERLGRHAVPDARALSRAVPDHPVYLVRVDGHAGLVNADGDAAARTSRPPQDPTGGSIERARRAIPPACSSTTRRASWSG